MRLNGPAIAINPNVLLPSLPGSLGVEVPSETGRATIAVVAIAIVIAIGFTLDWAWLPAPDLVQLEVYARLDMFAHVAVRKQAAGAKSGSRVKSLGNKFDENIADFPFPLTLYPLNLYL